MLRRIRRVDGEQSISATIARRRLRVFGALTLVVALSLPATLSVSRAHADGVAPDTAAVSISAGHPTTFGYSGYGQSGLGLIDNNTHPNPTQITAITNAVQLAAGGYHALALKADGSVWSWGSNQYGELGVPQSGTCSAFCSATPAPVTGLAGIGFLKNVKAIAAGDYFSLALLRSGIVVGWGYNGHGQLGRGTTDSNVNNVPVAVHVITNAVYLAASGDHALALTADGRVFAWGDDYYGETGDGTFSVYTPNPTQVAFLPPVKAIATGFYHNLALSASGNVYAWGYGYYGQLGNNTPPQYNCSTCFNSYAIPTLVANLTGVKSIAAGYYHSLAVKTDGTVWAWGYNGNGQLGTGTSGGNFNAPVQVIGTTGVGSTLQNAALVAAGYYHSLVVLSNGSAVAFGDNNYGDLGNASVCCGSATPVQVGIPSGKVATGAAAGYYDSFLITH
jgi:alpha-tubulin suppressor-like RCC1 family protein